MHSDSKLKAEMDQIRELLNKVIADLGSDDCNYKILMDISVKMDQLILEYIKSTDELQV